MRRGRGTQRVHCPSDRDYDTKLSLQLGCWASHHTERVLQRQGTAAAGFKQLCEYVTVDVSHL
jgi:hypothetical protein